MRFASAALRVYRIHVEKRRWQSLDFLDPEEFERRFPNAFAGVPMHSQWGEPVPCRVVDSALPCAAPT